MQLTAAPYRASGLVQWRETDIANLPNVRFARQERSFGIDSFRVALAWSV
jgi:hypothetical protein